MINVKYVLLSLLKVIFTVTKCLSALLGKDLQTQFSPSNESHNCHFLSSDTHGLPVTKFGLELASYAKLFCRDKWDLYKKQMGILAIVR